MFCDKRKKQDNIYRRYEGRAKQGCHEQWVGHVLVVLICFVKKKSSIIFMLTTFMMFFGGHKGRQGYSSQGCPLTRQLGGNDAPEAIIATEWLMKPCPYFGLGRLLVFFYSPFYVMLSALIERGTHSQGCHKQMMTIASDK